MVISSYCIDNLFIIYIKKIPSINVIREEHLTFLAACLVMSTVSF